MVRRFSLVFDLLGDVSYYVAHEDIRTHNIETMSALIGFIAESAPFASVLVAGHSLGSVLASQAIERLPSTYSGKARTVLLTMGSPLKLMSQVFPEIPSPDSLLVKYRSARLLLEWINLCGAKIWLERRSIRFAPNLLLKLLWASAAMPTIGATNEFGRRSWRSCAPFPKGI
jgi:pimeloyl-ACP methyl ester carboxylesterase